MDDGLGASGSDWNLSPIEVRLCDSFALGV